MASTAASALTACPSIFVGILLLLLLLLLAWFLSFCAATFPDDGLLRTVTVKLQSFTYLTGSCHGCLSVYAVARRINFKNFNSCHELWADDMRLESFHCQLLLLLLLCCLFVFLAVASPFDPIPSPGQRCLRDMFHATMTTMMMGCFSVGGGAGDEKSVIFKLWNAIQEYTAQEANECCTRHKKS